MDMDQAAIFLAGSILTALGFIAVVIGLVVINNIIARYWKPIKIFAEGSWIGFSGPTRFAEPHELEKTQEPILKK